MGTTYIIVTDMEGTIRIYRLPKGSLYILILHYISNYCVYCTEDQNLTHKSKCIEIFNQDH
jgi:hypothetical protein